MQSRKALVVGINEYASSPLYGCVADANAVAEVLAKTEMVLLIFPFALRQMYSMLMC